MNLGSCPRCQSEQLECPRNAGGLVGMCWTMRICMSCGALWDVRAPDERDDCPVARAKILSEQVPLQQQWKRRRVRLYSCPRCQSERVVQAAAGQLLVRLCLACGALWDSRVPEARSDDPAERAQRIRNYEEKTADAAILV